MLKQCFDYAQHDKVQHDKLIFNFLFLSRLSRVQYHLPIMVNGVIQQVVVRVDGRWVFN